MLYNLHHHEFRGHINEWCMSFLTNYKEFASVNNFYSTKIGGLVESPTISTLTRKCIVQNFDDDTNITFSNKKLEAIIIMVNLEPKSLVRWSRCKVLSLNEEKK